ncbi:MULTISPECIES: substrate-binding periplasmic protein [Marinobacter]|jgi:polar amino acid transport system substrate-binding protein|uniref:substrate-binding periplasmic protein n=1 Tax=Marinobacter TaxID=2742 RepID=UPI0011090AB0|nr:MULTISPECIES: transporter substrate-binding domain-containing protein [Marinobacter]MCK2149388.1 transporter substrate-binding domain-containing protein [Marinobacter alexandrii]
MISKHIFHFSPVGFRTLSALTLLVLMTVASGASAERLRLVTEEWPSLIDDTGEGPAGILWEVTREVLTNMGHEATVEFVPWKRAQRMVLEGKRDGIIGIGINDERKRQYRFPHEHLLLSETVVVSRKSHIVVFSGLESLAGLQIGVSPGYVYSGEIQNATGFERIAIPGIDSGLRMLMLGRIDAMLSNRYVVMAEAERLGLTGKIAMSATPVSGGPVYLTFRRDMPENFVVNFSNALKLYKTANLIADRPSSGL